MFGAGGKGLRFCFVSFARVGGAKTGIISRPSGGLGFGGGRVVTALFTSCRASLLYAVYLLSSLLLHRRELVMEARSKMWARRWRLRWGASLFVPARGDVSQQDMAESGPGKFITWGENLGTKTAPRNRSQNEAHKC